MWAAGVPKSQRGERLDWVLSILPVVRDFYQRRAGTLSGGQQQMVSICRALLSRPRCLLMDEPSIGLALKISDRVIVMKSGAIIHETRPEELSDNAKLMELY